MSSSAPFTGSALFLETITQVNSSVIKLKFAQDPLMTSISGGNDALNPNNYSISGVSPTSISSIASVPGDPQSVFINLSAVLMGGNYTVSVQNIETSTSVPLTPPTSLTFTASDLTFQDPVSSGGLNDSSEDIIRKHLSGALKGPGWDALIAGLATGDAFIKSLAQLAFKQLFTSTASGKYLDRKASDNGFTRPAGVGISDDVFRKLAIKVGAEKITLQSFLQVLEVYYGPEALRATADSDLEFYNLQEGDDLIVDIDSQIVHIVFKNEDFSVIGSAKAIEVASAITRAFERIKITAFAASIKDVITNSNLIRIYSGALGLRGYIRVLGGKAQNILNFPTLIETTQSIGTTWDIDTPVTLPSLVANRVRFTWTGAGTNPTLQLTRENDVVNIYGSVFNSVNRGAFIIKESTSTYFEIENIIGTDQSAVAQLTIDDIVFYRPDKQTINSKARYSMAVMGDPLQGDVIFAATTQAVGRSVNSATYLHNNDKILFKDTLQCSSVVANGTNITIVTTTPHGLSIGDTYLLGPGQPDIGVNIPSDIYTVNGIVSTVSFTTSSSIIGTATTTQYIYPCYRDSSGIVHIKTDSLHNLSSGQFVIVDNTIADSLASLSTPYITNSNTGLASSGYLNFAGVSQLLDGRVLVAGGTDGAAVAQNKANIYNPTTSTWSAATNLYTGLTGHTTTTLSNGRVLLAGGNASTICQVYDVNSNIWVTTGSLVRARQDHTAVLLNNNKVLVVGGNLAFTTAELYDFNTGLWAETANPPLVNRFDSTLTKLGNGLVLVVGGYNSGGTALSSVELYNPYNDSWITCPSLTTARFYHQAVLLPNMGTSGKVMISGGTDGTNALNTVELYDIATNTWSLGQSFTQVRKQHSMAVMSDGNVAQYGGLNTSNAALYTADIYYPLTNTWNNIITTTSIPGASNSMVLLNNNKLLITPCYPGINGGALLFSPINQIKVAGGLNGLFPITSVSSTVFTYPTTTETDFIQLSGINTVNVDNNGDSTYAGATSVKAIQDANHIGPYIYDVNDGVAITGIYTTTTQDIVGGQNYSTLSVTDASEFPNSGYLVFNFGFESQTTPVPFIFNISNNELLLDSTYTFPVDLPSGATINLLETRGGWVPNDPTSVGSFYLTDSISGRISASNTIDAIAATGVNIVKTVIYPSDIGLGNEGQPVSGQSKIADKVYIWGNEEEVIDGRDN